MPTVLARALEAIDALRPDSVEVLAGDDDFELLSLLGGAGPDVLPFVVR